MAPRFTSMFTETDLEISALAGSDHEVAATTAVMGATDLLRSGLPPLSTPAGVGEGERARLAALAEAEAQRSVFLGEPARRLDEVAGDLVRMFADRARDARCQIIVARKALDDAVLAMAFDEMPVAEGAAGEPVISMPEPPSRLLPVAGVAAIVADVGVVYGAASTLLGAQVYEGSDRVPWSLHLTALGTCAAAVMLGGALAEVLVRWWRAPREERSLGPVAAAAGVMLVVLALALSGIRHAASDEASSAGPAAFAVLALMSALVLPIVASACRHAWLSGRSTQQVGLKQVSAECEGRGALQAQVENAERMIERLERDLLVPSQAESAFDGAVAQRTLELRAGMLALERRARMNVLVRRLLVAVPPARKALLLRYAKGVTKAASMGAAIALLAFGPACATEPAPPFTAIAVCDGSGKDREAVCSLDALRAVGDSWVDRAAARPGSQFIVVTTGSGLPDTREALRVASSGLARDPRRARRELRQRVAVGIEDVVIPRDSPGRKPMNVSDGIAALHLTTRIVRELGRHEVDVAILSDGLWVSGGILNAERCVPAPEDAFALAKAAGMDLDLARVSRVRVCGLHTTGLEPAEATSRDRLVIGLLALAHAPGPVQGHSSCHGFFDVRAARAETE